MFDNKMIVEDSLKATDSGFTIEARCPIIGDWACR
ncbi:Uncharacterised protein [Sphingomonas paucimobilis]|nr:Uncharacterised protein [Sphingomonas paucimobilis]